jgi:hypothetical protein|uniref:HNH endonuclease n=1 Tax=viral metagenome TaxID=1070528 RepID=A0A6C0AS80_9ZZZZ
MNNSIVVDARKTVQVDFTKPTKKPKQEKIIKPREPPKKRIITETEKWTNIILGKDSEYASPDQQFEYIKSISNDRILPEHADICRFIMQQIGQKINGYRSQDIEKELYTETSFVDSKSVLEIMVKCENQCYYCKNRVHILYEYVREPKQWTLERIDNKLGHNKTNVVIACLNCNLHRKTMHTERYLFTKQLNIVKSDESS